VRRFLAGGAASGLGCVLPGGVCLVGAVGALPAVACPPSMRLRARAERANCRFTPKIYTINLHRACLAVSRPTSGAARPLRGAYGRDNCKIALQICTKICAVRLRARGHGK